MLPDHDDQIKMMRASVSMGLVAIEAQMIVAMRLWGMMGLWNTPPSENMRMISEKAGAMIAAQTGAARAILAGEGVGAATLAAVEPVAKRTRQNVKRLVRRGPKIGP